MKARSLAFYFLGLFLLVLILYWGLNLVERGITELMALESCGKALSFCSEGGNLMVTFAGKEYHFRWGEYWERLSLFFQQ